MRFTAGCLLISVLVLSTTVRAEQPSLESPELGVIPATVITQPYASSGSERSLQTEPLTAIPATPPAISTAERIVLLEKAAAHLAAAGMADEAKHARREADRLRQQQQKQQIADQVLEQKLADLERLQSEIDTLRAAAGRSEQILIRVQVLQVSVAKMREAGFDFPEREADCGRAVFPSLFSSKAGDGQPPQSVSIHAGQYKEVAAFVEALRQQHLLKIVAEPTLVTSDKRPTYFTSGGEVPFPVVHADGSVEIERREFGTHVDLLPKMLGQSKVRLAIHSRFSEMDSALKVTVGDVTVPAVRAIEMDTDFDAQLGQTTVLGEMTGRDAKTVKNDETGQESRVVDEVRTFFLVTPDLVTPEVLEAMVARGGQCTRCTSDEQGPAPADAIDSASARTPSATRRY